MSKTPVKNIDLTLRLTCGSGNEPVPQRVYDALVRLDAKGVTDIDDDSTSEEEQIVLEWAFENFGVNVAYSFGVEINDIEFYDDED